MSTALFLITHEGIASNLLTIGEAIVQKENHNFSFIEVPMDASIDSTITQIENKITSLNIKDGIIFITDIFGSTPSNIAQQLTAKYKTHLISGVNLPMIIRFLNYREESYEALLQKTVDGGHFGIQLH